MSVSKEERQQARIDIRSWGADEKPELAERLLNALDEADSEKADLRRENQQLRDKLTSTDAERRFWENEVALVADSLVNSDEEDDADDEDVL